MLPIHSKRESAANISRIYRFKTLLATHSDLKAEIEWLNPLALKHQKNYQIWHHRQSVINALGSCDGEHTLISQVLELDSKNYHVWSYRQWTVSKFGLWDDEQEWMF